MRENWTNDARNLELSRSQVQSLTQSAIPDAVVCGYEYAAGGLANTNICVRLSPNEKPVLLRLFVRDPVQAQEEAKIHKLIEGKVPAARVLHFSADNPVTGHPFFDFGNLLRPPLGALPGFESSFVDGYRAAGCVLSDDWRRLSLLTDLTAWFDFLSRKDANETIISDARKVIQSTMDTFVEERRLPACQ